MFKSFSSGIVITTHGFENCLWTDYCSTNEWVFSIVQLGGMILHLLSCPQRIPQGGLQHVKNRDDQNWWITTRNRVAWATEPQMCPAWTWNALKCPTMVVEVGGMDVSIILLLQPPPLLLTSSWVSHMMGNTAGLDQMQQPGGGEGKSISAHFHCPCHHIGLHPAGSPITKVTQQDMTAGIIIRGGNRHLCWFLQLFPPQFSSL